MGSAEKCIPLGNSRSFRANSKNTISFTKASLYQLSYGGGSGPTDFSRSREHGTG
jgi:hypothetical protein